MRRMHLREEDIWLKHVKNENKQQLTISINCLSIRGSLGKDNCESYVLEDGDSKDRIVVVAHKVIWIKWIGWLVKRLSPE